jgi:LCP family protein required for cell wall assembly
MSLLKRLTWFFLLPILILACVIPGVVGALPASNLPQIGQKTAALVTIPPDATATATPFLPVPPTPTYIPTPFPEALPTATPGEAKTPEPASKKKNVPAEPLPQLQEQINIMILGSDQRPGEIGFRTDTIILLNINPAKNTTSMVSFPRDLYVYIPGWTYQRINTAMYLGGFSLLAQTMEYNFGVKPDHYIMVGLDAFMETIDSLGGIDVRVAERLRDHRTGHGYYTVKPGQVHMDGETALWYVRARYTTNDFDRTRRQQEVIQALAFRLISVNALENADELYDIYSKYVTTDLKWKDLAPLVPVAVQISDPAKIQRYAVGPGEVIPWVTPGGAQVLLPNEAAIQSVLREAIDNQ